MKISMLLYVLINGFEVKKKELLIVIHECEIHENKQEWSKTTLIAPHTSHQYPLLEDYNVDIKFLH